MARSSIASLMRQTAILVAVAVVVTLPAGYAFIKMSSLSSALDFKARLNAGRVAKYVFANSELWEFHGVRLSEVIAFSGNDVTENRQTILSRTGRVVFQESNALPGPILWRQAPIVVYGEQIGTMIVETSLRPMLSELAMIAFGALLLAAALLFAFYRWPKRIIEQTIRALEQQQEQTKAALINLSASEAMLVERSNQLSEAQTLGRIGDWSYVVETDSLFLSPVASDILQLPRRETGIRAHELEAALELDSQVKFRAMTRNVICLGAIGDVDVQFYCADGSSRDLAIKCQISGWHDGRVTELRGTIQDITDRKSAERQLESLAYYDPLTGLANRSLFKRELTADLDSHFRTGSSSALIILDLDRFKEVNDSLGHAAGDELLTKVAQVLVWTLDTKGFIARLGGDEFAILLKGMQARDEAAAIAQSIVDGLSKPFQLGRGEVAIGASIGIVMLPEDGETCEAAVKHADLALYRSKDLGRGRFAFFDKSMDELIQQKVAMARDLRNAASRDDELEVWFQPQIDLHRQEVIGFEALMRWKHPVQGYIPPSVFIPIAESSSLISEIGLWILRESARTLKGWIDAGGAPYTVSVNLSAAQIWQSDVAGDVAEVLAETGLPPHLLCLELTESLLADHTEIRVQTTLSRLKALGVSLALDDFGTGYSSLGYLSKLPFDKLKIDRMFIADSNNSDEARQVLKGIVALGHGLGMEVVAEGIENSAELALLRDFACDLAQGYYFARPETAASALLRAANLPDQLRALNRIAALPATPVRRAAFG